MWQYVCRISQNQLGRLSRLLPIFPGAVDPIHPQGPVYVATRWKISGFDLTGITVTPKGQSASTGIIGGSRR